jgi:hypothetical protein
MLKRSACSQGRSLRQSFASTALKRAFAYSVRRGFTRDECSVREAGAELVTAWSITSHFVVTSLSKLVVVDCGSFSDIPIGPRVQRSRRLRWACGTLVMRCLANQRQYQFFAAAAEPNMVDTNSMMPLTASSSSKVKCSRSTPWSSRCSFNKISHAGSSTRSTFSLS